MDRMAQRPRLFLKNISGLEDRILIRDARGRSARPALIPHMDPQNGTISLQVQGPFTVLQRFVVDPERGASFAHAMRDENPIHIQGEVIPGAMTAARALILPEFLIHKTKVKRAKLRFRGLAYYRRPSVNVYRIDPDAPEHLKVEVTVYQEGSRVADGQLLLKSRSGLQGGKCLDAGSTRPAFFRTSTAPEIERIRMFLESLGIEPALYFQLAGLVYPRAYLAALPPGEMIRKFSGEGGILNSLDFEFPGEEPLGAESAPTIELEKVARTRRTFRKIVARIARGVRTLCSGFALVLPREAAESLLPDGIPDGSVELQA